MWKPYLLRKNIQRYQALLDDPGTAEETRKVVGELLAEATADLSALGEEPMAHRKPRDGSN